MYTFFITEIAFPPAIACPSSINSCVSCLDDVFHSFASCCSCEIRHRQSWKKQLVAKEMSGTYLRNKLTLSTWIQVSSETQMVCFAVSLHHCCFVASIWFFFLPLICTKHRFVLLHEGEAEVENELELEKDFFEERFHFPFASSNDCCNLLLRRD